MRSKHNLGRGLRDLTFCGSISTIFLLLTTTCSPLYAFNDWVDSNSFLTMGKGILNGVVPYRDLFEQKGPLLYFLHSLAYLMDQTGFVGVFIIEVITMTLTLLIASKLVRLFVPSVYTWFIIPLFACLPLISTNFESGDSAEELCFPLIMGLLYILARHFKDRPDQPLSVKAALLTGVLGGCVFMMKYTMIGYWIGFALVLTVGCIFRRQIRGLLINIGMVVAGFMLAMLPWAIYFGINNAIDDFIYTYITVNIKYYAADLSLIERIRQTGLAIASGFSLNLVGGLASLIGIVLFASKRFFSTWGGRLALPACGAFQIIATYFGGSGLNYYYLAFFPFVIFGLIAVASLIERGVSVNPSVGQLTAAAICYSLLLIVMTISISQNIPQMKMSKAEYPQYSFAEIINKVPNATLLNFGFLDGGFYTAANITPRFKYFMLNNISHQKLPEMLDEQIRYVTDCEATFVVLRMNKTDNPRSVNFQGLHENYTLVSVGLLPYKNNKNLIFKYALFQLNESIS